MKNVKLYLLILLACLCGCNYAANARSVSGTAKFEDGTSLTRGQIFFVNDTMQMHAYIHEDGTWKLNAISTKVGIPSGTYKIYILATEDLNMSGNKMKKTAVIDKKYTSPKTTDLTCEIKGMKTTYDIVVPAATGKKEETL